MKIQVLGAGCPSCKKLFELTKQAVNECGIEAEVEYVSDIQKIIEMGVMSAPVLVIDGKVAVAGSVPDIKEIKKIISGSASNINERPGCSCGGKCQ
jgi:small redox-active disulfide protein 2